MPKQIRILIIEDSEEDTLLLIDKLEEGGFHPHWIRVDGQDRLLDALNNGIWDLILCDYHIPGFSGFKALSIVKERNLDIPFIFVSATTGEDIAVEAMKKGAHDWVLKQSMGRLLPAIERELREADIRLKQRIIVESMRNLSLAVQQSPVSVVITNTKGEIEFVNPKFSEVTGYSIDEVIGQNPRFLKSSLTPPETYKELWSNISSGKEWRGELCNKKKNGDLYWEIVSISPVYNSKGVLTSYVGVKEDITEQKQKADELRENEEKYRILFESEVDAKFLVDLKTEQIIEANNSASVLYGFSHEELLSMKNSNLSNEPLKTLKSIKDKEKTVPCRWHRKKDGTIFPVEIKANFFKYKNAPVYLIDIRDITERIIAEKNLSILNERYNLAVLAAGLGVWDRDVQKNNLIWNERMFEMYGLTKNSFEGNYGAWQKCLHPDDVEHCDHEIQLALQGVKDYDTEFRIITPENIVKNIKAFGHVVRDESGNPVRMTGVNYDITAAKKSEEALNDSREQLAKFAAHLQNIREEERVLLAREIHDELGQILTAIKIDMGLLKQKIAKGIELTTTQELLLQLDHLFSLVDKTIKTTRKIMTELRPEVLDALGFIEAVRSSSYEFQERHNILCTVESNINKIDLNSQQSVALFRIFQEALSNVARHSHAKQVKINLEHTDQKLVLKITDNGIGLDDQHKKKVDSYGIIGMRERVFLLDGQLDISGKSGVGTTVKIEIPYDKKY
jgi:PAS domain S-box-containing protein